MLVENSIKENKNTNHRYGRCCVFIVLMSGIAFNTFSFAATAHSSIGAPLMSTVSVNYGSLTVQLESKKPIPSGGLKVVVSGDHPNLSSFYAKEKYATLVKLYPGKYDVNLAKDQGLDPKYIGECAGTIKAQDHLECLIDPYGK